MLTLLGSLLLSGCLHQPPRNANHWLERYQLDTASTPQTLIVCQNMGCSRTTRISLSADHWHRIRQHFEPPASSAAEERQQIAAAIGTMELIVGPQANTAHDEGRNALFASGPGHQLDCIAETTNSTRYLTLFYQNTLLHWHIPVYPAHRGPLQLTGPHFSAAIAELSGGQRWVVDSWFHANGQHAVVIPLEQWRSGFNPPDS